MNFGIEHAIKMILSPWRGAVSVTELQERLREANCRWWAENEGESA